MEQNLEGRDREKAISDEITTQNLSRNVRMEFAF